MGPINYLGAMPQIDLAQSLGQGFQLGANIGAASQEMEQRKLALEQAQQYKADVAALMAAPTADKPKLAAALQLKNPKYAEGISKAFGSLNEERQKSELNDAWTLASALHSKRPDLAIKQIDARITARKNSGLPVDELVDMREWVEKDPDGLYGNLLLKVGGLPGGDKILTNLGTLGKENREADLHPAAVREAGAKATGAEADAQTKGVQAKYAERDAIQKYEKEGWNIKALQADIEYKKQSTRIETMKVALSRSDNDLKRKELQLKIDAAERERDSKVSEKIAQAETEIAGVTDMKDLIGTILADKNSLRAVTGASAWKGAIPGTENRAMAGKIEQLVNMAAAINLDKLKGPMSDKDILFVKRISANLDRYQDEDQFEADLLKLYNIADRAESKLRTKYGAPAVDSARSAQPVEPLPAGWTVTVEGN